MLPKTRRPAYVAHCHGPSSSNSLPARPSPPRPQALRAMLRAIRRPPRRVRPRAGRSATQSLGACYLPVDETGGNSNSAPCPPQTPASPANGTIRRCVGAKARSHPRPGRPLATVLQSPMRLEHTMRVIFVAGAKLERRVVGRRAMLRQDHGAGARLWAQPVRSSRPYHRASSDECLPSGADKATIGGAERRVTSLLRHAESTARDPKASHSHSARRATTSVSRCPPSPDASRTWPPHERRQQ